jgi:hypothetical protein
VTSCTIPRTLSLLDSVGDGSTLDEVIVAVWEGLGAHRTVECPVCGGQMSPEYGAHARAIGGRCSTCGSTMQ